MAIKRKSQIMLALQAIHCLIGFAFTQIFFGVPLYAIINYKVSCNVYRL